LQKLQQLDRGAVIPATRDRDEFSRTVISANSRLIWNVRATP
jgi:hypothetical protein